MLTVKTSILALLMAVSALLGGYAVWQLQGTWYEIKEGRRVAAQAEADQLNRMLGAAASFKFETQKAKNEVRYKTVTVEVEKLVDRPVYQSACLDADGLGVLNDLIARRDAGKPQPAVPGTRPAARSDGARSAQVGDSHGEDVSGLPGQGRGAARGVAQ